MSLRNRVTILWTRVPFIALLPKTMYRISHPIDGWIYCYYHLFFLLLMRTPQSAIDRATGRSRVRRGRDHYADALQITAEALLDWIVRMAWQRREPVFGDVPHSPTERKEERKIYKQINGKSIEKSSLNRYSDNNIESPHQPLIALPPQT